MELSFSDPDVHCPVFKEFLVVPLVVYNSFVAGTDIMQADIIQMADHSIIGTGTQVADAFEGMFNVASPQLTVASKNQTGDSYPLISTEVAEILADTNELQTLIADNKISSQVKGIDADAITASALKTDAVTEITAALWAKIVDGTITFEKMSKLMIAFIAGNYTWDGSVMTVKDQAGATLFTITITDTTGTGVIS
jgi:hypothetical protein